MSTLTIPAGTPLLVAFRMLYRDRAAGLSEPARVELSLHVANIVLDEGVKGGKFRPPADREAEVQRLAKALRNP